MFDAMAGVGARREGGRIRDLFAVHGQLRYSGDPKFRVGDQHSCRTSIGVPWSRPARARHLSMLRRAVVRAAFIREFLSEQRKMIGLSGSCSLRVMSHG